MSDNLIVAGAVVVVEEVVGEIPAFIPADAKDCGFPQQRVVSWSWNTRLLVQKAIKIVLFQKFASLTLKWKFLDFTFAYLLRLKEHDIFI